MAPRVAIKAPVKFGLGCLVVFALPFVSFGLFAAYQTKFGMSSGQTSYYDPIATSKGGRKVKLASSIKGRKESEWFAHEIQNALARK